MGKNLKAVRRAIKKFKSDPQFRAKFLYAIAFDRNPRIDENCVLLESFNGTNFGGNPFYVLQELATNERFGYLTTIVSVNDSRVEATRTLLSSHGFTNTSVVAIHSQEYIQALLTSKYLVNNSTFPTYFTKRPGQVYLNTWHGTPLKTMGRKMVDEPHKTGNTQRNFLMADYLLYPNEFSFERFRIDYMIGPYFSGKYVMAGYPCNTVFYDNDLKQKVREKLGLGDEKVVAYMPTWRQGRKNGHKSKHFQMLQFILMTMDEQLDSDVVVFAKPHYYDAKKRINFKSFKHVKQFPSDLETYELLSVADLLITDYSSVMFDFLNANKRILLLPYDQEEYFETRGAYIPLDDLPFDRATDAYDLCKKIREATLTDSSECTYREEKSKYCRYDDGEASRRLCQLMLSDAHESNVKVIPGSEYHNDKQNVIIFGGALTKNGITTSLQGLLDAVDPDKANYLVAFLSSKGASATDVINGFHDALGYYPMQGEQPMSFSEAIARFLYFRFEIKSPWIERQVESLFSREAARLFPSMTFAKSIHFGGYERNWVHLISAMSSEERMMFVHNDMLQERSLRSNYHIPSITKAYQEFDKVIVVRESLKDIIAQGFDIDPGRISTVHNINRIDAIRNFALQDASYDRQTSSNVSIEELKAILEDNSITKFISVGRFSPEKGHKRLISAFCRYSDEYPNSALMIIGGHGVDHRAILDLVEGHPGKRIVIIKSLSNPFPILASCDAFILSSFYEGLPMSIMEALILGKPVISTAISGPKEFLEQGYGRIVDDSEDGLYEGMCDFEKTGLSDLKSFDAEAFNAQAVKEFYDAIGL